MTHSGLGEQQLSELTSLRIDRQHRVIIATIDNPRSPLNAVDKIAHAELCLLFGALADEEDARAVVLTGTGDHFSAGGDIDWIESITAEEKPSLYQHGHDLISNLLGIKIPVVMAVNGPAVGVGATIALLGDVIIASDNTKIADPHVRVGLAAGDGAVLSWPAVLGPALAKRYLLTGDAITAQQAHQMGLITDLVPAGQVLSSAIGMAERLASLPPDAVQYTKKLINRSIRRAYEIDFGVGLALEHFTLGSHDQREAIASAKQNRQPQYKGH